MSMIHELTPQTPRNKLTKRKGRGESSGHGKTSGKGNKGAGARQGGPYWHAGHEGGQTTAIKRMPKRGFSNDNFERRFYIVNLGDLNEFANDAVVDGGALIEAGLVPDAKLPIKILGNGELTKKLTVLAGWYSKSAHAKILAAGGAAQNVRSEAFEFPKPKKIFVPREAVKKPRKIEETEEAKPAAQAGAPAPEQKPAE
jgi:large subunit ribosomal protein L15